MLTLPIKKKWFDMIVAGEKKEEYRDIKPYYDTRFLTLFGCIWVNNELIKSPLPELQRETVQKIAFRNGYSKNAPTIIANCELKPEKAGKIGAQNRKKPITFYQLRASQTARLNNKEAAVEKRKNNLHRH